MESLHLRITIRRPGPAGRPLGFATGPQPYSARLECEGTVKDTELVLNWDGGVAKLLREAHADGKLIGTWGNGLEALTRAGVVKGRKVTGSADLADAAKKAGARFTGRQLEAAGHVVTALDEGSGMRFGQALVTAARS